jgi:voltage-gated potassium channel
MGKSQTLQGGRQVKVECKEASAGSSGNQKTFRTRVFEIVEVAGPHDPLSKAFDIFLIALILLNVVAIILESVPSLGAQYGVAFQRFDLFSVMIFSVEYVVRIWTAVERKESEYVRLSESKKRLLYARSPAAIVDLLAILPFYIDLLVSSSIDLRILRAFRLLRIFKLTRYSQSMTLMLSAITDHIRSFIAAITILVIVMLLAASGMYVFEKDAQPEAFGSIPHAMWWAFATLTTVGYGDVTPITVWGKVFGAAITVVGIGMVALPAGILASAFSEQLRQREKIYEEVVQRAYEDGVVDEEEERELKEMRLSLGLNEDIASRIQTLHDRKTVQGNAEVCPCCGTKLGLKT